MWGVKDEFNYYIKKKAPVVIRQELNLKGDLQWTVDVKETLEDEAGVMTLSVEQKVGQAIKFCEENELKYQVASVF